MLPYLLIIAEARYYIPLFPFLAILAAIPIADKLKNVQFASFRP
jgi:hypothetical protein